jgi:hypothetical protein
VGEIVKEAMAVATEAEKEAEEQAGGAVSSVVEGAVVERRRLRKAAARLEAVLRQDLEELYHVLCSYGLVHQQWAVGDGVEHPLR